MVKEKVADKRIIKLVTAKVLFLLLFLAIIASCKFWLPLLGRFLLVEDNIQKADCIVPLLGDPHLRFKKATELYREGYANSIVVSYLPQGEYEYKNFFNLIYGIDVPSPRDYILKVFMYFDNDPKDIYLTNVPSTSTYDEAVAVKEIMLEKGFGSLILVTSGYHARRARIIFKFVFRNTGIKILSCTAMSAFYDPNHWWMNESDVREVILEYSALIHNLIYHIMLRS